MWSTCGRTARRTAVGDRQQRVAMAAAERLVGAAFAHPRLDQGFVGLAVAGLDRGLRVRVEVTDQDRRQRVGQRPRPGLPVRLPAGRGCSAPRSAGRTIRDGCRRSGTGPSRAPSLDRGQPRTTVTTGAGEFHRVEALEVALPRLRHLHFGADLGEDHVAHRQPAVDLGRWRSAGWTVAGNAVLIGGRFESNYRVDDDRLVAALPLFSSFSSSVR